MNRSPALNRYLFVVTLVGLGVLGAAGWGEIHGSARSASAFALAGLVVVGEMVPLRVPFHGGREDVTLSTTFVFALLLMGLPTFAILQVLAVIVVLIIVLIRIG